jgi:hypothetical protein
MIRTPCAHIWKGAADPILGNNMCDIFFQFGV